jgi:hypothetical protein
MKTLRACTAVILTSMLLRAAPAAGAARLTPRDFPWQRAIAPEGDAARAIGVFALDEDFLGATDDDFGNLRIFDGVGNERPFLVRPAEEVRTVVREVDVPVRTTDFKVLDDNRVSVVVERSRTSPRPPASVLVLSSPLRDFEKTVAVFGSDDAEDWVPLTEGAPIFDYSRYLDLRNDRVAFPASTHRYYRLEIANISEEHLSPLRQVERERREGRMLSEVERVSLRRADFRIDTIRLLERREAQASAKVKTRAYGASAFSVENPDDGRGTVVAFATARVPLTRVGFDVEDRNFCRSVLIEGARVGAGEGDWVRLAEGTLTRVEAGAFRQERVELALPRVCRYERYRATIRNLDSPPLRLRGVTLAGEQWECAFLLERSAGLRVLYGGGAGAVARYDIDRVLQAAGFADVDRYTAGPPEANPAYRGRRIALSGKVALVVAVVAMIGVLGWVLYSTVRKIDKAANPPPEAP